MDGTEEADKMVKDGEIISTTMTVIRLVDPLEFPTSK
jgi:hypothetical protein